MRKIKICTVITDDNRDNVKKAEKGTDIFEVRIDLIGSSWPDMVRGLKKPWIATNRSRSEHGLWAGSEEERAAELLRAVDLGAWMVDIELESPSLDLILNKTKGRTRCLISHHEWENTPPVAVLAKTVEASLSAGAYACKVVTTAHKFEDNLRVLRLFQMFPAARLVAFAMGSEGLLSRVISPLAGALFTYASIKGARASASGQIAVQDMRKMYGLLK